MIKKSNDTIYIKIYFLLSTFTIVLILFALFSQFRLIFNNAYIPCELREIAIIKSAYDFACGTNTYLYDYNSATPPLVNFYGIVTPLYLSIFVRFFYSGNFILVCDLAVFLIEIIGIIFLFYSLYKITKNFLLSLVAIELTLACFWRYGVFGGAFPDQLGLGLSLILIGIISIDEYNKNFHPILYAIIITILFHTKAYFILYISGIILLLLVKSRKNLYKFVLSFLCMFLSSIFIIDCLFPLYFSETIGLVKVMDMGHQYGMANYKYAISQLITIFKSPFVICIIIYFFSLIAFFKSFRQRKYQSFIKYSFIQSAVAFLPTFFISQNEGAYVIYHLQLWLPCVIFASALFLQNNLNKKSFHRIIYILLVICITLYSFRWDYLIARQYTMNDINKWNKAYTYLEKYSKKGSVIVPMHLSYYNLCNNIYTNNFGQTDCLNDSVLNNFYSDKNIKQAFPMGERILIDNINYRNFIKSQISENKIDYIILTDGWDYNLDAIIKNGYIIDDMLELRTGSQQSWDTYFLKRKSHN